MKETQLTQAIEEVIRIKLKAVDLFVEKYIEPLTDVGNPEKLIGKPYEQWTPDDLQRLVLIYGEGEPNILSDFIFKKEYEKVKSLEEEL